MPSATCPDGDALADLTIPESVGSLDSILDDEIFVPDVPKEPPPLPPFSKVRSSQHGFGHSSLENVLNQEFTWFLNGALEPERHSSHASCEEPSAWSAESRRQSTRRTFSSISRASFSSSVTGGRASVSDHVSGEIVADMRKFWSRLLEQRWFEGFFMLLTMYALFVPDIDLLCGDKESKFTLSIVTSFVCVLFMVEMVLQSIGRETYVCTAYFWLDFISIASMLPDTWIIESMFASGQFVAGRSSRLNRIIYVATRSSKAARLNRWRRIARVATLIPRLQRMVGNPLSESDAERLLEKKLQRIFHFLDEDSDGHVSHVVAERCAAKIALLAGSHAGSSRAGSGIWTLRAGAAVADSLRPSCVSRWSNPEPSRLREAAEERTSRCSSLPQPELCETAEEHSNRQRASVLSPLDPGVDLEEFRGLVQSHPGAMDGLRRSCKVQIAQGNNMQIVTSRNSEFIAVKVALCVLFLLFLLSFMMETAPDTSAQWGLCSMDRLTRSHFANHTQGAPVPLVIKEQLWIWAEARPLLYLDLDKRTVCNDFGVAGPSCSSVLDGSLDIAWGGLRTSLRDVDLDVSKSPHRYVDMGLLRVPDFSAREISAEELERKTTAVAVLDNRLAVQAAARTAMWTSVVVIVVIVTGIWLLTRDLTWFSRSLLRPLVELADEMESISRLQLSAVSATEDTLAQPVCELRVIRRSFSSLKNGIVSWGKYVPWPVVQLLMRKDAEANLEVKDAEVTVFFSDIASFTTIVESLPPERSLALLSRYFHDMSKIIDDYKGIVLEYIGDAIMAVYGAPIRNKEHPISAVKAALRMLDALRLINQWFLEENLPEISIRCGVHTGRVVVGNMGFGARMKYGVIGEQSEVPSRLEELNKNYSTKLLISRETYDRLSPETFVIRPIDYVYYGEAEATARRSRRRARIVYEVLARHCDEPESQQLLAAARVHAAALQCYRGLKFEQAAVKFGQVQEMMSSLTGEEDVPSSLMRKRCEVYLGSPPSCDWDGVWDRSNELH